MKVIIPLAGKGTRLRPHTHVTPKPMLRVAGKPVMEYVLDDVKGLRGVEQIQRLVAKLSTAGRTVIAISHDMRFVAETFARVVVMEAGRVTLDGTPADVFAAANWDALARTYVEPPLASRIGARLGLGSTPTDAALVEAIVAKGG